MNYNYNQINKLYNKKLDDIFEQSELTNITSTNVLGKCFMKKFDFPVNAKLHVSKLEHGKPKEMMTLCSVANDFDDYINGSINQSKLFDSLQMLYIIFLDATNSIQEKDYVFKGIYNISEYPHFKNKIIYDAQSIISKLDIDKIDFNLEPTYSKYIVLKKKDNKPYKNIYSKKLNKIISECRYGWYFTKNALQEINELINVSKKEGNMDNHCFYNLISQLKTSANDSVTKLDKRESLFDKLYIEREIEKKVRRKVENTVSKQLILLIGNSGDGKSTIIRKLLEDDVINENFFDIHNDATETFYPNQDAIETLLEVIEPFSDENIDSGDEKVLIAINMGIIGRLIEHERIVEFSSLKEYIMNSSILKDGLPKSDYGNSYFDYFSFSEYYIYTVSAQGFNSDYIKKVFKKIFSKSTDNIFYNAFNELDDSIKQSCPVVINYEMLLSEEMQQFLFQMLALVYIDKGVLLTSRIMWNFVYDLLFDEELERIYNNRLMPIEGEEFLNRLLPNKLFNPDADNEIIMGFSDYSNLIENSVEFDNFLHTMHTSSREQMEQLLKAKLNNRNSKIFTEAIKIFDDNLKSKNEITRGYLNRLIAMMFAVDIPKIVSFELLDGYSNFIFQYNVSDNLRKDKLLKSVKNRMVKVVKNWNGKHYKHEFMNSSFTTSSFKKSVKFDPSKLTYIRDEKSYDKHFYQIPMISYNNKINLFIDYKMYCILQKMHEGYQLNAHERMDYIRLNDFVRDLVYECTEENIQYVKRNNSSFEIYLNEHNEFIIRKD